MKIFLGLLSFLNSPILVKSEIDNNKGLYEAGYYVSNTRVVIETICSRWKIWTYLVSEFFA